MASSPLYAGSTVAFWGRKWPWVLKIWAKFGYDLDEHFALGVDRVACKGCPTCVEVCPKGVFEMYHLDGRQKVWVACPQACEQCTACVKQCPEGAILAEPPIRTFVSKRSGRFEREMGVSTQDIKVGREQNKGGKALRLLLYGLVGLPLFLVGLHTIVRVIRYFYKFPIPQFLANAIDNPLRRRLQPPYETAMRHGIEPGMTVLEVGPGNGTYTIGAAQRVGPMAGW